MNTLSINTISYIQQQVSPFIAKHLKSVLLAAFAAIAFVAAAFASVRLIAYASNRFFSRNGKQANLPISKDQKSAQHNQVEADKPLIRVLPVYNYLHEHEGNVYLKVEGDQLKIIPFKEFVDLSVNEREKVLEQLEKLIESQERIEHNKIKLNKTKQIRNQVFYSLHKSEFPKEFPLDMLKTIAGFTSPKGVERLKSVNKAWSRGATRKEQILSLNTGLRLKDALPPKVLFAKEALDWLKKDLGACKELRYADFRGFADFSEDDLRELVEICPNLTHLFFRSDRINKVEKLPASLQVLDCSQCSQFAKLPDLPASLQVLSCDGCQMETLPDLPASLQLLSCRCWQLAKLPNLPESLQKLVCAFAPLAKLPDLPASLLELDCSNCSLLATLPDLPESLQVLNCCGCVQLAMLPDLPPSLESLNCGGIQFAKLPDLPASLRSFHFCRCPQLEMVPDLPALLSNLIYEHCPKLSEESLQRIEMANKKILKRFESNAAG